MSTTGAAVAALAVFVVSLAATRLVLQILRRRQILDEPNERSSHSTPIPRGLGIAVVPVVAGAWLLVAGRTSFANEVRWICAGALVLAVLSWIDDLRDLPIGPRLAVQVLVTAVAVFMARPPVLLGVLMVVLWMGIINQVNFTDGIDGHLGAFLVSLGVGLFVVSRAGAGGLEELGLFALLVAAAAAGFLIWNWHPARGFMGDVGSVPLGFLVGWLLLRTFFSEWWFVAAILPLFYFADTFMTYSRRVTRVRAFWRPHREYLYQRATKSKSHAHIVTAIAVCNVVLLALAIVAARGLKWAALAAAVVPVAATYAYLSRGAASLPR